MTSPHSRGWSNHSGPEIHHDTPPPTSAQGNRRRLRVFLGTLAVALALSLGYTLLRPAEYRATSRLEITPAVVAVPSGRPSVPVADSTSESRKPFLTDVEVLTSRPVLEQAVGRLERAGYDLSALGPDPIANIQAHLQATPIASTNVVELVVTCSDAGLTAPLLNAIVDLYRDRIAGDYRGSSSEVIARADEEARKLEATVATKRRDVENFRLRHNIVSLDRGENEVLARVRNMSTALGTANDRVAAAEGKLRSLTESAAAGKSVVRARDDPTLANLEQRTSQAREDLQDLERSYTPDYLAKDPRAVTLRTRIAELDRQVKVQRETGQQAALLEAQQDFTSAQEAARRIQGQIASDRQQVGEFTAAFNEYKSRQDELAELEAAYRNAVERKAKLEASEGTRMPSIRVLEAAVTPQQPWRPLLWRDAAVGVAGSFVLALLAMWLVELFNRSGPQPTLVIAQSLGGLPYQSVPPFLPGGGAQVNALPADAIPLLPRQASLPRELDHAEVTAIIRAGDDADRVAMLLLLAGVSLDELINLRWTDVDLAQRLVRIDGESAREVALPESLHRLLADQPSHQETALLVGPHGGAGTRDSIDARILCAAHDAGLESATEVTSECLRHTYIAFLVRQRIRFADLTRVVGHLSREVLGLYSSLSPTGSRAPREEVDLVLPAVRELGSG
jgi:succinoglycan biosynthesis transport protein ExoP